MKANFLLKHNTRFFKTKMSNFTSKVIPGIQSTDPEYGNILDVGKMGGYHQFLEKYHKELGPVFSFYILKDQVVSLGHPKYWSAVSHLQDRTHHIRLFLKPLFGTPKTINLTNGQDRADRYKKYITPLMNKEAVDGQHAKVFEEHIQMLMKKWVPMSQSKTKVPINEHFSFFILSNMIEILFGKKNVPEEELLKLFDYMTFCVVNVETKTLTRTMDDQTEKEIKEKVGYIHSYIRNAIRERVQLNVKDKTCLTDWLMTENDEEVIFTDAMTFFFGSIHTTISHLTFTVYHLAKNQNKQRKLQEELDKFVTVKEVSPKHVRDLKYLRACINESLRITPPVTTSTRVDFNNDVTLPDDYVIKKGTPIILPLGLVLLDPNLWEDPTSYNPERFKEQGIQFANQFSPFGFAGGRVCAGKLLAALESQMIIGTLFKNFNVSLTDRNQPLNLHLLTGTTPKDEIYINLTPRH